MKQSSFDSSLSVKKTRKPQFLVEMNCVGPWAALIAPYYPKGKSGRRQFAPKTMPRIHFMQQWFTRSDPAMKEAFFDIPLYCEFAELDAHGLMGCQATGARMRLISGTVLCKDSKQFKWAVKKLQFLQIARAIP